ncbi:FAD-dependent oxidoreductase [Gordonia sp. (in: high G+C Gram-positive bacteria)]|uniref:FAD-dependent oxidoreductase n=1 Tax=Gordonia sp. (in: high G+C Gram-positive bacteria) TaxID=84139 RepID=UPI0016B946B6|nr:FAD-dependent oxidoreductase [Gordonia sp. (in: high G+C Gram-positive bacteria)]NLG45155.1 FAD-dependent oxidoreductase [Gordonia sp. (in: high G+C Gram-positive bacteria)]
MTHIITRSCCNDGSCVAVCPVNCIHPTPDEPDFLTAEMLYIDPETCIDCGACVDECPVSAIYPDDQLPEKEEPFLQINADYYKDHDVEGGLVRHPKGPQLPSDELRVAIVGAGPAAFYAAQELVKKSQVKVDMFDRLPTPYGLVRAGVSPDHAQTKGVETTFAAVEKKRNFTYHLGVEVGEHITHDELRDRYGVVLYAVGAAHDRRLDVPGEDLAGSIAATDFVGWYNGHPDHANNTYDLSGETVVVIGNGNVALDVARILVTDPEELASTDIADHALEALRSSKVREVVVIGRRGIEHGAFTNGEFVSLADLDGVDIVVDEADLILSDEAAAAESDDTLDSVIATKVRLAREFAAKPQTEGNRRIVFRFLTSPTEIVGDADGRVDAVNLVRNEYIGGGKITPTEVTSRIETGMVVRSIGYRSQPIKDLPFDDERHVVPNEDSRVLDGPGGDPLPGVFVAGWIKRGPTGGIGRNRLCGEQAATSILADFANGVLPTPSVDSADVPELVGSRGAHRVDLEGWKKIDAAERESGKAAGRRRVKFISIDEMFSVAGRAGGDA